jgi:hypothetical protein
VTATTPRPFNDWDALKILAILIMFIDHAGIFIFHSDEERYTLRAIGRGAAPIFLFLAGFAASYKFDRGLFLWASVFSLFDFWYGWRFRVFNILFTILVSRAIFNWFETRGRIITRPWEWYIGGVSLFMIGVLLEYGSLGFLIAFSGYLRRHADQYEAPVVWGVAAASFATYAANEIVFPLPPVSWVWVVIMLSMNFVVLMTFQPHGRHFAFLPQAVQKGLKCVSRYSMQIYVLHLIGLILYFQHPL